MPQEYEPVTAEEAVELYLTEREENGAASSTITTHDSRLSFFVEWFADETEYDYLWELSGLDFRRYRTWRFAEREHDYSVDTVRGQLGTLRKFIRWCVSVDAVPDELPSKIQSPDKSNGQRSNVIEHDRFEKILDHVRQYQYASLRHALLRFLWMSMARVSGAHSLDLEHVDLDRGYAEFEYKPDEGTTLKNREAGERTITIDDRTCEVLRDYLEHTRPDDVVDEYGREPFFVAPNGSTRAHTTLLRNRVYAVTRPCVIGGCPHETNPDECDAAASMNAAHECPSSESTHAIRRGSISWHLREEVPKPIVSDRADVGKDTLDEHYSTLSEREKADVRSDYLPDSL